MSSLRVTCPKKWLKQGAHVNDQCGVLAPSDAPRQTREIPRMAMSLALFERSLRMALVAARRSARLRCDCDPVLPAARCVFGQRLDRSAPGRAEGRHGLAAAGWAQDQPSILFRPCASRRDNAHIAAGPPGEDQTTINPRR